MTTLEVLGSYMTNREAAALRWHTVKPAALALLVGLVAGPYISNALGWQVTSGTATDRARAGIVAQLASICDARARTEVQDPGKLEPSARSSLAKTWAIMPGGVSAASDDHRMRR